MYIYEVFPAKSSRLKPALFFFFFFFFFSFKYVIVISFFSISLAVMVKIVDLALRAVSDSFVIHTINSSIKK